MALAFHCSNIIVKYNLWPVYLGILTKYRFCQIIHIVCRMLERLIKYHNYPPKIRNIGRCASGRHILGHKILEHSIPTGSNNEK